MLGVPAYVVSPRMEPARHCRLRGLGPTAARGERNVARLISLSSGARDRFAEHARVAAKVADVLRRTPAACGHSTR
ncbi:hypothetical protein [Streptomyces violaceus]|uniref:MmyB family transcriptional regulator n=1 Tax=Streptomyces violaceus TaxID=1936 RepID=UPI0039A6A4DA